MEKKKILFVINTLGRAGAETALMTLLRSLDPAEYDISLYVIMAQGELIKELPDGVRLLNSSFSSESVLTSRGRRHMFRVAARAVSRNGHILRKIAYTADMFFEQRKRDTFMKDKLLWRLVSDGAERFDECFDLAVAFLEGASTYYVADHVSAKRKAAFVHTDYESAGYTPKTDRGCYDSMDEIFAVSDEVRQHFLKIYPQYAPKVKIFHNIIDKGRIERLSREAGGFDDDFDGTRILTVGRLIKLKAYDMAIEAMHIIKGSGCRARWYVLGEGEERAQLEQKIEQLGLEKDFKLLGAVDNPFPYYRQADIYVHATRYEGKSLAIQEAQILDCPVIASDCNGNREQVEDGVDGRLCRLEPEDIAEKVKEFIDHPDMRRTLALAARCRVAENKEELEQLLKLAND